MALALSRAMQNDSRTGTLTRSALVGVAATVTDLAALWLLVAGLGVAATAANVPSLLAGVLVQFVGNKHFAFQDSSRRYLQQGAAFAVVEVGALALNAALFHVAVSASPLPFLLARLLWSAVVYFAFSYPLWGLIFRRPDGG